MSYQMDAATGEGTLRILLDDITSVGVPVVGTDYFFEDDELTALLDLNSDDIWYAAADGCRRLASKFAKDAIILGLGNQDIYLDLKKKSAYYLELAKDYSRRSGGDVTEFIDSYSYNVNGAGNDNSEYSGDF